MKAKLLVACALLFLPALLPGAGGEIFKEYTYSQMWNERDPGATNASAKRFRWQQEKVLGDVDLDGAIRAELAVEYWGGHLGTTEQKFRVNGNDWILLPQPEGTPTPPMAYHRTLLGNPPVAVPLTALKAGRNVFQFACGPQLKQWNFGWGWYLIYAFTLRVYYDDSKPHVSGTVVFPYAGATVGDSPVLVVQPDQPGSSIRQVDFIGFYEDFDWEGNGRFQDWHYQLRSGKIAHHLGTAVKEPYAAEWDTSWVPDQRASIAIRARITASDGTTYLTPETGGITLARPSRSVTMYPARNVREAFGSYRTQTATCEIEIPDDLAKARAARLVLSTWSGEELSEIGLNDKTVAESLGQYINYSYDSFAVPLRFLRQGTNTFFALSTADYHKAEINWPGPALFIERSSTDEAGKARLVESMLRALGDHHWPVRAYAARALGGLDAGTAVEPLIARLKDESWQVRADAAAALGNLSDARSVEPLLSVIRTEKPYTSNIWRVRKNAVSALGKIRDPRAVEILIAALKDPESFVRAYAAYALGEIKDRRAVEPLRALLQGGRDPRRSAEEALAKLAGEKSTSWERRHPSEPQ